MADRQVVLIGTPEGPLTHIHAFETPILEIRGLPAGGAVELELHDKIDETPVRGTYFENGRFPLDRKYRWMRARQIAGARSTIIEVHSR